MGKEVFFGTLFYGSIRPGFHAQKFSLDPSREAVDASSIEDRARRVEKGPLTTEMGWEGSTDSPYEQHYVEMLAADQDPHPFTVVHGVKPTLAAPLMEGFPAYIGYGQATKWVRKGERGAISGFDAALCSSDQIFWGSALMVSVFGAGFAAPAAALAVELGAIDDDPAQQMVAVLHVPEPPGVSGTGVSIIVKVQSSVDGTVGGTWTDRIVFATLAGIGDQLVKLPGPVTDTFWRANATTVSGAGVLAFPNVAAGIVTVH